MNDVSLRANRLAVEFEAYGSARRAAGIPNDAIVDSISVDEQIGRVQHDLTVEQLEEAAELLRERGEGVTVTAEQSVRIRQTVGRMPYSGLASMRPVRDLDELLDWLDSMRDVLTGVAARAQQAERELHELQRQRDAVRSFLGLGGIEAMHADVADLVETVDSMRVEQSGDLG